MDSSDKSQSSQPSLAAPPPAPPDYRPLDEPISQAPLPPPMSKPQRVPLERDLTNRLVGVIIWFSLATSAGCVMEMAETKAPPNVAGAMKLGLVAASACAYKDLEKSRMPLSLLKAPQQFFSKLIVRLDNHSVQLEENTVGQEQLEEKIDALTLRVDTLTLAMVRPPALSSTSGSLAGNLSGHPPSVHSALNAASTSTPTAVQPVTANGHSAIGNGVIGNGAIGNGHVNSGDPNLQQFNNGYSNGRANNQSRRSLGAGFSPDLS